MWQALTSSLNPAEGGSNSRNLATTRKLQLLQQICGTSSGSNGNTDPVLKTSPEYVGIVPQLPNRIDNDVNVGQETEEKEKKKVIRTIEDGLLMVVSARIYGRKIRTLIDSGATRCFVSPACVTACGLKGRPRDIFLELGNVEKIISRGYILDVPVVTTGVERTLEECLNATVHLQSLPASLFLVTPWIASKYLLYLQASSSRQYTNRETTGSQQAGKARRDTHSNRTRCRAAAFPATSSQQNDPDDTMYSPSAATNLITLLVGI